MANPQVFQNIAALVANPLVRVSTEQQLIKPNPKTVMRVVDHNSNFLSQEQRASTNNHEFPDGVTNGIRYDEMLSAFSLVGRDAVPHGNFVCRADTLNITNDAPYLRVGSFRGWGANLHFLPDPIKVNNFRPGLSSVVAGLDFYMHDVTRFRLILRDSMSPQKPPLLFNAKDLVDLGRKLLARLIDHTTAGSAFLIEGTEESITANTFLEQQGQTPNVQSDSKNLNLMTEGPQVSHDPLGDTAHLSDFAISSEDGTFSLKVSGLRISLNFLIGNDRLPPQFCLDYLSHALEPNEDQKSHLNSSMGAQVPRD